jgi:hypothetical protein
VIKVVGYVLVGWVMLTGVMFAVAPLKYALVLWQEYWDIAERACQCAGC